MEQIDGIEQAALKHCRGKISFCPLGRAFNSSIIPLPLLLIFFSSSKSIYRSRCDHSWNFKLFGIQCVFLHFSIQWSIHLCFSWPQNCWENCSCYRSILSPKWPPCPHAPFPAPAQDKESSSDSQSLTMAPAGFSCLQNIPAWRKETLLHCFKHFHFLRWSNGTVSDHFGSIDVKSCGLTAGNWMGWEGIL